MSGLGCSTGDLHCGSWASLASAPRLHVAVVQGCVDLSSQTRGHTHVPCTRPPGKSRKLDWLGTPQGPPSACLACRASRVYRSWAAQSGVQHVLGSHGKAGHQAGLSLGAQVQSPPDKGKPDLKEQACTGVRPTGRSRSAVSSGFCSESVRGRQFPGGASGEEPACWCREM